ncbi:MAG TPA: response regulator transcription factor [Actinomycetota bacterium]|jgi:DNA-binding NarL/FixJ family response regulator|nr:response regulator transcription factor [Actinomycetota bacterium]
MKVLVVEDQMLFAEAIQVALRKRDVEVVGIARSGQSALDLVDETRPDVVLLDIGLPDRSGLSVGREMLDRHPDLKVLALTALTDGRAAREALRAGFSGYLTKDTDIGRLVRAIQAALAGEVTIPIPLARQAVGGHGDDPAALMASQLTDRERDVLALLAEGADSTTVAERCRISRNTVRTHVQSILSKLNVHSRLEAAAFAVRHGIVPTADGRRP